MHGHVLLLSIQLEMLKSLKEGGRGNAVVISQMPLRTLKTFYRCSLNFPD